LIVLEPLSEISTMTAALLLFAAQTMAAPVPEPFAVLDLGPPPKGLTVEEHRKRVVTVLTSRRYYSS
jgi:hypothetical protein